MVTISHYSKLQFAKGYSPVGAFIHNCVVPQYLTLRPEQLIPENCVNHDSETYKRKQAHFSLCPHLLRNTTSWRQKI